MIKRWNVQEIQNQISSAMYECTSPYNDGFTAWGVKQDLYRIKWAIDRALDRCPEFTPEPEWLKEQEQLRLIEILKHEK